MHLKHLATSALPTKYGLFAVHVFEDSAGKTHLGLLQGALQQNLLVRLHSECLTGDVFGSERCDCGEQLHQALTKITQEKSGLVIYLRQEGRGIGLPNKIKAYALQDQGLDTVEANHQLGFKSDEREYAVAAAILDHFGISSLRLLTNNPEKISQLEREGLAITARIPLLTQPTNNNKRYLQTKKEKLGHIL